MNSIFAWNVPLVSLIFFKRSLVFPILLFSSITLHWSLRKALLSLLASLWISAFKWEYLSFLLCLSILFFSQLFVRLPQTTILPFCVSFPWGWSWPLSPVQCHEPPFVVHQALHFCFIDYAKAFDCVDHNKLWKILKETGIPDHLTCLLRNLYAGQEAS